MSSRNTLNPLDVFVGSRIRLRRTSLGISQERLAIALGVASHDVDSYETGVTRVAASRLFDVAHALDVAIRFFFEECSASASVAEASDYALIGGDAFRRNETAELVRAYYRISDVRSRKSVLDLVNSIATTDRPEP